MNENDFAQLKALGERKQAETLVKVSKGEYHEHILETSVLLGYLDKGVLALYRQNKDRYTGTDHVGEFGAVQIDELIALLQKAKALMQGGE